MPLHKALYDYTEDMSERVPRGSKVKLLRYWTNEEAFRWGTEVPSNISDAVKIGQILTVLEYRDTSVLLVDVELNEPPAPMHRWLAPAWLLEVVEIKERPKTIKLNEQFTAEISPQYVTVGCTTFKAEKVLEVAAEIEKARQKEIGQ